MRICDVMSSTACATISQSSPSIRCPHLRGCTPSATARSLRAQAYHWTCGSYPRTWASIAKRHCVVHPPNYSAPTFMCTALQQTKPSLVGSGRHAEIATPKRTFRRQR